MTTDNMTMERKCEQLQSPENPRLKILSFLSLPFKKKNNPVQHVMLPNCSEEFIWSLSN